MLKCFELLVLRPRCRDSLFSVAEVWLDLPRGDWVYLLRKMKKGTFMLVGIVNENQGKRSH